MRKEPIERIEGTVFSNHTGPGVMPIQTCREEKALSEERALCSSWGTGYTIQSIQTTQGPFSVLAIARLS